MAWFWMQTEDGLAVFNIAKVGDRPYADEKESSRLEDELDGDKEPD